MTIKVDENHFEENRTGLWYANFFLQIMNLYFSNLLFFCLLRAHFLPTIVKKYLSTKRYQLLKKIFSINNLFNSYLTLNWDRKIQNKWWYNFWTRLLAHFFKLYKLASITLTIIFYKISFYNTIIHSCRYWVWFEKYTQARL